MAAVPLSASLPDSSSGGSTIKNDDLSMKKGDLTKKKPWYIIEYYSILGFCHEIHRVQDENFITTSVTATT